ncbi:MAG: 4Fe-4S dicluster domain-containing protein [Pseudomonadota bacterium]
MAPNPNAKSEPFVPDPELMALWPDITGDEVNGLGDEEWHQPRPVFWRADGSIAHTDVLFHFYKKDADNERIAKARKLREKQVEVPYSEIADTSPDKSPQEWVEAVKAKGLEVGADDVGIALFKPEWVYNDREKPQGKWAIVLAFAHEYDNLSKAPHEDTYIEVMVQYARAGMTAKLLANWIREQGHHAEAKMGPNTEDVLMIPPAIEAGMGELGKHGSLIHRKLGANFRLSMVMTDMPLVPDAPDVFGADDFCQSCQVCTVACPPDAISPEKQVVNGVTKWYVNFDKCLPYFIDDKTCGICLAVCPWSRPGIADNLVAKMARRREAAAAE